jgi:hypothetical protein
METPLIIGFKAYLAKHTPAELEAHADAIAALGFSGPSAQDFIRSFSVLPSWHSNLTENNYYSKETPDFAGVFYCQPFNKLWDSKPQTLHFS